MGQEVSGMRCVANRPQNTLYGWQRKCLFLLLLGLFLQVFLNFAVTLWLIKVLEFNVAGIKGLNILSGGLELPGHTFVLGSLVSSNIYSFEHPIKIQSPHNFTMDARDRFGRITNSLFIDEHKIQSHASLFAVSDSRGRNVFSVDRHEVVIGADSLRLTGVGGSVFDRRVHTNEIVSGIGTDLRLETPNTKLQITAPSGITVDSIAGDISATAHKDIKLESIDGRIRLEASGVYLPGLPLVNPSVHRSSRKPSSTIYQLCSCNNGKLFLAPANGHCVTSSEGLTCR